MSAQIIYPQGGLGVEITVAAGDSIAVYTKDVAQVYKKVGYPNMPESKDLVGTVNNQETVFGPYASGATIIIEAGAAPVLYNMGVNAQVLEAKFAQQGTPTSLNATGTLTAAKILTGIVTSTTAAGVTATLDTGAVMEAAIDMETADSFDWCVINTGANAFTVTAAASGHTVGGAGAVAAGTSGMFRTRKTGTNTFVTYRVG